MDSPLEGIAFLARSENRVAVLRAIEGAPRTRQELRGELSTSRTTLARILNEFESRELIVREGRNYSTSPTADAILEKFVPLLETMEGIHTLGEATNWLPPPTRTLDLGWFHDATVSTPTAENPTKHFGRGLDLSRSAEEYRSLTVTGLPRFAEALRDDLVRGEWTGELVIEASFLYTLRNEQERAIPWYDFAEAGILWIFHGRVPINLHIVDGRVLIWLVEWTEPGPVTRGLLESENPALLEWAESLYDDFRAESEPLEPSMFPEG